MKKTNANGAVDETRYNGTFLGKPAEPRVVKVEGGEISSIKEWSEKLKRPHAPTPTITSSRRQSSALSSLGDETMEDMVF
jgi:transcription initiation factor TFIID subunit 3